MRIFKILDAEAGGDTNRVVGVVVVGGADVADKAEGGAAAGVR